MASIFDEVIDRRDTRSFKWSRYDKEILPLWVADMDFRAPEPVRDVLRAMVDHGVYGYELPSRKLAETVAQRMGRLYNWNVSPEMVVAIPGIVAGFKAAARAVARPGGGVLMQPPVYHPFLDTPEHSGTVGQFAPLRRSIEGAAVRYEVDWDLFDAGFNSGSAQTEMFLLCHPHNPIGQSYGRADLERMAERCLRAGVVICSDEIHSELMLGGAHHLPLASLSQEIADRAITLVSSSKTFNVVGLFCGFAIIPNAGLRQRYRKVLNDLALHVNSFGLAAAEAALSGACDSWLEELRCYLTNNRDLLVDFVRRELPGVRTTTPEATYLAWLDFGELVRAGRIKPDPHTFLLREAKVALNPGAEFGAGGEDFVRLNFGCPRATLMEALGRIRGALR